MSGCHHLNVLPPVEGIWVCKRCKAALKADPHDRFFTGPELAKRMVEWAGIEPGMRVLEPSAGDGGLVRFIPEGAHVTAVELIEEEARKLRNWPRIPQAIVVGNFLHYHPGEQRFDLGVMNPPYSSEPMADGIHVARALRFCQRVVALVRTNFLHGFGRYHQVFRWAEITREVVFSRRPPFYGPADSGHTARHDYLLLELQRRKGGEHTGAPDRMTREYWV